MPQPQLVLDVAQPWRGLCQFQHGRPPVTRLWHQVPASGSPTEQ